MSSIEIPLGVWNGSDVAYGKDSFASRMLGVAHDLGVQDPMDPMDAVEMIDGILARRCGSG